MSLDSIWQELQQARAEIRRLKIELRKSKKQYELSTDSRKPRSKKANKKGQGRAVLMCESCGESKPVHQYDPILCDTCYGRSRMRYIRRRIKDRIVSALKEHSKKTGEYPARAHGGCVYLN